MRKDPQSEVQKLLAQLNMLWFMLFFSVPVYAFIGIALEGYSSDESTLTLIRTAFYLLTLGNITLAVSLRSSLINKAKEEQDKAFVFYKNAVIIPGAVAELIGVYGFILLFMGDRFYGFPLLITAGLTLLYLRPRRGDILSIGGKS